MARQWRSLCGPGLWTDRGDGVTRSPSRRKIRRSVPGLDAVANLASSLLPTTQFATRLKRMNRITHERSGEFVALSASALGAGVGGDSNRSIFDREITSNVSEMSSECEAALLAGYEDLTDARQKFFVYDLRGWLANELLIRADKITMAHSLEARVPYLDHRLVEFCLTIPARLKVADGTTKAVLRKAMERSLPPTTARRKQHGFVVPIGEWIRNDWRELVSDLSRDSRTRSRGIFDVEQIDEIVEAHMSGRADWTAPIFGFLLAEIWHRTFLDA
jgi:asparagine synthetase B (glutamine-hydrolysing)